jgi:hypothetical protein
MNDPGSKALAAYIRSRASIVEPGLADVAIGEWAKIVGAQKDHPYLGLLSELRRFGFRDSRLTVDLAAEPNGIEPMPNTGPVILALENNLQLQVQFTRDSSSGLVLFLLCHDPPTLFLKYRTLKAFLDDYFTKDGDEFGSCYLDEIGRAYETAVASVTFDQIRQDPELALFSERLGPEYRLYDLRSVDGAINYEDYDPTDPRLIVRHADHLIYGMRSRTRRRTMRDWAAGFFRKR